MKTDLNRLIPFVKFGNPKGSESLRSVSEQKWKQTWTRLIPFVNFGNPKGSESLRSVSEQKWKQTWTVWYHSWTIGSWNYEHINGPYMVRPHPRQFHPRNCEQICQRRNSISLMAGLRLPPLVYYDAIRTAGRPSMPGKPPWDRSECPQVAGGAS